MTRSKLILNRSDNGYYQDFLVPLVARPPQRGFAASTQQMRLANEFFTEKIQNLVAGDQDPGLATVRLIEEVSDLCFFTVISVTDEVDAYQVFETLNARGVQLSASDLLKNFFFRTLASQGRDATDPDFLALERRWDSMVHRLGGDAIADFLGVHWNSCQPSVRPPGLFRAVRAATAAPADIFRRLTEMEADVDIFLSLARPDALAPAVTWRSSAQALNLFSTPQVRALLLAAHRRLGAADFDRMVRALESIVFRYNIICGLSPFVQERTFNAVAQQLSRGTAVTLRDALDGLRAVYPTTRSSSRRSCRSL